MRYVVEVENEDGSVSVLSRGEHGQPRRELAALADAWRATRMFGNAQIRVTEERPGPPIPVARAEPEAMAEALA